MTFSPSLFRLFLLVLLAMVLAVVPVTAQDTAMVAVAPDTLVNPNPEGRLPSNHQDSVHLGRLTSGVMPPDGLLAVVGGLRKYNTVHLLQGRPQSIDHFDFVLRVEAGLWPWLQLMAQMPWRSWSGGVDWVPSSGSGLGDGSWQATVGGGLKDDWLAGTVSGGSNLPFGSEEAGLTEGVVSPHLTGALTFRAWTDSQAPEMRVHLNLTRRWNRSEDTGYGVGTELFEPWFPRYNDAAAAGGESANDYWTTGAALEFRKGTSSLWFEYVLDLFVGDDTIAPKERPQTVSAGLRWGVMEGWAVRMVYEVGLARDDPNTPWYPAFPELVYNVAVSKEFSLGGRDRDGDGVPDRHDNCPDRPEDIDGFQDDDGCPDLDNDLDGIPDYRDGLPDAPEDYDGFRDEDGIPDPDNDLDGVPDIHDECPDEAEDFDGDLDEDGCPDDLVDTDGDGIADMNDGCPETPEDLDGYEDWDGCPDEDNDLDGILDEDDDCPNESEDYDGVEDDDGCPDLEVELITTDDEERRQEALDELERQDEENQENQENPDNPENQDNR